LLHLLDLPDGVRLLALLSRQIVSFVIPTQLFVPLPVSLITLWACCLSFLASLWLRAVVVGGVGRAALVAHDRLRAHEEVRAEEVEGPRCFRVALGKSLDRSMILLQRAL
jgi:hypothetical protein